METRVAVISIIVEEGTSTDALNQRLHVASPYLIGRMGFPYRKRGPTTSIVAFAPPQTLTFALSGHTATFRGGTTKTAISPVISQAHET